ncbi:site-specific DNA-methyltransferase (adenine-specific) [Treponema bryantii]|uniref:Methyltransferase n=1 Tax=Treponema bryantii TaxID=163 RepID=A0A1H9EGQ6_9SPIR|nr:DNA methyltransferase [Treponema bryantii]BDC94191.1 methyltransferase [Treponema bryantii]SEQ24946.1 site-specific DNA-methyltransferase (adenine-specific) [Treponema bryantii]
MEEKKRAGRNRTITLSEAEKETLKKRLIEVRGDFDTASGLLNQQDFLDHTINADLLTALPLLPDEFADLIIIDPPYNLTKNFNGKIFTARDEASYEEYLMSWFPQVCKKLKPSGSLYMCGDWKCTAALQRAMESELSILNRITWQREKGRGAKANWKNGMEDIWFGVKDPDNYYFDIEAVKQKRRVIAPYRENGKPKDWEESEDGNFRLTCPSNFWDDISVPFWSMPENTDHPTQKPEKLYAKLILASSRPGDVVFDPFLGSGTASVVAKKLGRHWCGVELNEEYCMLAEKRLELAETDKEIQGYSDGVFWERNSAALYKK